MNKLLNWIYTTKLGRELIDFYVYEIKRSRDFVLKMMPKNAVCAEVGVYDGKFSESILRVTHPKILCLIDLWEFDETTEIKPRPGEKINIVYETVLKRNSKRKNVKIYQGTSDKVLSSFPDEYFDWLYIDGDHRYEGVKSDLKLAVRKVKNGGFIAGDDYVERNDWGVIQAVQEIIKEHNLKPICIEKTQYILKKEIKEA